MTRTRMAEYGKGMAAVAFLLFWTALLMSGPPQRQRMGTMFWLWIVGWVFFGAGGGATFRWRDLPALARLSVLVGASFIAFGLVWPVVYKQPWVETLSEGIAAVAAVIAILAAWVYLRAAAKAAGERSV